MRSRGVYRIWKREFPNQGVWINVEELRSILRHSESTRDIILCIIIHLSQLESDKLYTSLTKCRHSGVPRPCVTCTAQMRASGDFQATGTLP